MYLERLTIIKLIALVLSISDNRRKFVETRNRMNIVLLNESVYSILKICLTVLAGCLDIIRGIGGNGCQASFA